LNAHVQNPNGSTARQVCRHFFDIAVENASADEAKYLWIVKKRIDEGNLSELIRGAVLKKAQRTDFKEAVVSVYSKLINCLSTNQPYF
jgi:hypothetical protein